MSDAGLIVLGKTEPPSRYDVTVTVTRDDGYRPDPAEFTVAAEHAASSRAASVMSAHIANKITSIVTVETANRSAPAALALAVVSEALKHPAVLSGRLWPSSYGGS